VTSVILFRDPGSFYLEIGGIVGDKLFLIHLMSADDSDEQVPEE